MHACPHCHQPGIRSLPKLVSLFLIPAQCRLCHKRSYLHHTHGVRAMVVWVSLTWVFIGIALFERMSIYLVGTIPALVFAIDKYLLKAPLQSAD